MNNYSVTAKDASRTELDSVANAKVCERALEVEGPKKDFIKRGNDYLVIYSFSEELYAYTYAVKNLSNYA